MSTDLEFRKIKKIDLPFLNEVRNMFSSSFLHDSRTFTLKETEEWFDKYKPDYYIIRVEDQDAGYFRLSNHSKENRNIYIGADLHPDFWGKGIATEAYKKFMTYLFDMYDLNKISLEVLATNQRAINLYNKLGFVKEGVKRQEILKKDGFVDSIIMSVLKSEWYA